MYIIDTNTISELRKRQPNQGVMQFFQQLADNKIPYFISVITQGELFAGVYKLLARNDTLQAQSLKNWIETQLNHNQINILDFDQPCAMVWAELVGKNPQNATDKQIGATALVYDLTLVTRNVKHFVDTPVKLLNPFSE